MGFQDGNTGLDNGVINMLRMIFASGLCPTTSCPSVAAEDLQGRDDGFVQDP